MTIDELLSRLSKQADAVGFDEVIAVIDNNYEFTPVAFSNDGLHNDAGQNFGSCKIFGFAKLHDLTEEQTLHCFGDFYRNDVLLHPEVDDHQNIRNFMKTGWAGVSFDQSPLK